MLVNNEWLQEFHAVFGDKGGDQFPGNVGISRTAANVCRKPMEIEEPVLFDYFDQWDKHPEEGRRPFAIEQHLVRCGQWEGAWALAQLHYDQILKHEAKNGIRKHKGHPLCNLALVGQDIGSPSLTRHYAL